MKLELDDVGRLKLLELKGEYFATPDSLVEALPLEVVHSLERLFRLDAGEELVLCGSGASRELVRTLLGSGVLEHTRSLRTHSAPLSIDDFAWLARQVPLRRLRVFDCEEGNLNPLRDLLRERPDLTIEVDRKVVELGN